MEKLEALAKFFECSPDDLKPDCQSYGLDVYSLGEKEYAIGTDDEADEAAKEYIEQSLWAFNADFILEQCGLPLELSEAISAFTEKKCEGANDSIQKLIERTCGLDSFCRAAIRADGRGHFLASYDSTENEMDGFYVYRIN